MTFIPVETDRIDHSFSVLDHTYSDNKNNRNKLMTKLMKVIDKIDIDPKTDKARDLEVKLQIFNTAASILNDDDKQSYNHIKVSLTQKADENNSESNKQVIELLKTMKTISTGEAELPMANCDINIEEMYVKDEEDDISELELRLDASDLS